MKILMLDLEGVLVADAMWGEWIAPQKFGQKHRNIRPGVLEFLDACESRFDQIWMNTCVGPERTAQVLHGFGREYGYWDWYKGSGSKKTDGYEQFLGHTLVHVEDMLGKEGCSELRRLGMLYVPVQCYDLRSPEDTSDTMELPKVIQRVDRVLQHG
jgi:hypothetical protein